MLCDYPFLNHYRIVPALLCLYCPLPIAGGALKKLDVMYI